MLDIALMLFNGLRTLRILSDFRLTLLATRSTTLKMLRIKLPKANNDEIDEIPPLSKIRVLVEDKTHSDDFYEGL